MHKGLRIYLALKCLIWALFAAGFVVWDETSAQPMPDALASLLSEARLVASTPGMLESLK
jgi:hypothetical protein